ncbi:MAG: Rhizobium phage vB RleM [Pseudomonadota bacterium]
MAFNIPSNLVAPLFAFDVQSGGAFENENRLMLFGHATGSLAAGKISACNSDIDARTLCGAGSMLESMYLIARKNAPAQEIWIGHVAEATTAEVRTITVDDVPASGGQGVLMIDGERIAIDIAAGATEAATATALAAAINAYYNRFTRKSLPFTAAAASAVVTLTARHKGTYASRLDIYVPVTDSGNPFTDNLTFATTTAGAGDPDISDVIAEMGDDPFEMIACPFADAANRAILEDYLSEVSGNWSYARQLYGHAFTVKTDTASNLTTYSLAIDSWHVTTIPRFSNGGNAQADYIWLAAFVARIAPWFGGGANGDVSRNQTGLVVEGISAPRDRGYWPAYAQRDAFLKSGLSTWSVNRNGDVVIDKIITHQQTTNGAPDTTFRDIQRIGQLTYALRKFRADLTAEHANKALADENPAGLEAITTPKDIRNTLYHSYKAMVGVLENAETALENIDVTRDSDNANRVNVVLPLDFVNALDIFAGLAKVYSQFR